MSPNVYQRFAALENPWSLDTYNFKHFGLEHILFDVKQIVTSGGLRPGEQAPDFELPVVGGGQLRLSELRDKPVILHFGSFT
ncbi:MAG: redoxin domain-containing protein [Ardenticatenales bacterium]|nr:redoxin domain-containing protein [Ardenticatenales bacterium]